MNRPSRRTILKGALGAGPAALLGGCASGARQVDLGALYSRGAQRDAVSRNPVILVPGIMGSRLEHGCSGERIWGVLEGGNVMMHAEELAHPMAEGVELFHLRDEIVSGGVLDQLTISFGARIEVKAYTQLLSALGAGGYRDEALGESGAVDYGSEHYSCFQFDYDWRRSCVENAAALGEFISEKRSYVEDARRKRFGTSGEVKFDIVAHSMGGLITRYFQMYGAAPLPSGGGLPDLTWAGARQLDKVILVAPPNAGSGSAFDRMVNGYKPARLLGRFSSVLLGTMPSLYELLPRQRHRFVVTSDGTDMAVLDPEVWKSKRWGLADPRQESVLAAILPEISDVATRRRIALDHQRKCLQNAARFQAALDRPTTLPEGASLYLFAGDSVPSARVMTVSSDGAVETTGYAPGDRLVTRLSALLDERGESDAGPLKTPIDWTQITFIPGSHMQLTRNPTLTDNLLHLLLER